MDNIYISTKFFNDLWNHPKYVMVLGLSRIDLSVIPDCIIHDDCITPIDVDGPKELWSLMFWKIILNAKVWLMCLFMIENPYILSQSVWSRSNWHRNREQCILMCGRRWCYWCFWSWMVMKSNTLLWGVLMLKINYVTNAALTTGYGTLSAIGLSSFGPCG